MGDRNFYFIYTGHDRVFDGLSESEIEISDGTTWNQKLVKIQNGKKMAKIGLAKKSQ